MYPHLVLKELHVHMFTLSVVIKPFCLSQHLHPSSSPFISRRSLLANSYPRMVSSKTYHTLQRFQFCLAKLPKIFRFGPFFETACSFSLLCSGSKERHSPAYQTTDLALLAFLYCKCLKDTFSKTLAVTNDCTV